MTEILDILVEHDIVAPSAMREGHRLVADVGGGICLVLARNADLPWLLMNGYIDLAIGGDLAFLEAGERSLSRLRRFSVGKCRLSLLGRKGDETKSPKVVCTRYQRLTREFLPSAECVPLAGCNEIGIVLGFADAIVDVVETGATAKAMGLTEWRPLVESRHGLWAKDSDSLARVPRLGRLRT